MKLLYCESCQDIIAPFRQKDTPRRCICQRHAVWWADPHRGEIRVFDMDRLMVTEPTKEGGTWTHPVRGWIPAAFIIGMTNSWLQNPKESLTREDYEAIIAGHPDTFLFNALHSVAVRVRPGASSDSRYADLP